MTILLETLINDERLHILFKSSDAHCAVQLWLLQIKKDEIIETRLIYGRVLPYNFSNNKWSAPNEDNFKSFDNYKAQVIRINLYCKSNKLSDLIAKLCLGNNISIISNNLGFGISDALREKFGDFALVGNLCYRAVSYLPMRDDFDNQCLKSPHGSAGAFSGAIIPFNKKSLFFNDGKIDNKLFTNAINLINSDTGMSFDKEDIERLGDLELLVFPTLDDHERNLLNVDWLEKRKILNISLEQGERYQYDIFYIKTNFTNDGHIVYSSLKAVQVSNNFARANFEVPDYLNEIIDGLYVEIHAQKNNDINATLYCQYGIGFIRQIGTSIHLMPSFSGRVKSDWMTKVTKLPVNHDRIIHAQSINQGNHGSSFVVGGRKSDPWVSINRNNKTLLKKALPEPSEGRFFERYNDGNGLGRLEFVEWLKKILNVHQNHQIIIFDPYFEDAGISLLVPNASTNGDYVVFTTNQKTEPERLNNIIRCCEQLSVLTNRIKLRVFALANKAFHDRYILISEKNSESIKGFHLSNSIQKANENYPLLITPIPPDVLIKVNNYALSVLDKETASLFFDSKNQPNKNTTHQRYERLLFLNEKVAGTVLAKWTGVHELNNLSEKPLKIKLEQLGFLQGESLKGEKFSDCTTIFNFFSQANNDNFQEYWDITGHILANTPSGDFIDNTCETSDINILHDNLLSYLKSRVLEEYLGSSDALDAFGYCQQLNSSMDTILHHEHVSEFCYGIKFAALSWGDYYAVKILWRNAPNLLLDFIEENKDIASNSNFQKEKSKIYSIMAQAVSEIALNCQFGLTVQKILILINRNNDFLKWFGYCSLKAEIIQDNTLLSIVVDMPKAEKIMLLGSMINRISNNTEQTALFEILVKEYLTVFPSELTKEDITCCVNYLRGHMKELGWCEPWLFRKIVMPLIDNNRVNIDDLAMIWINELETIFNNILSGQSAIFKIDNEGRTTNITAFLVANSSLNCQKIFFKQLEKILKDLGKNIQKPLASSSNWTYFDSSLKVAFWIYGLIKWTYYHLVLPNLNEPELLNVFNIADKLQSYRTESEWKKFDLDSQGLSIFLKNRAV